MPATPRFLTYKPHCGENIAETARKCIGQSQSSGFKVRFKFNGVSMTVDASSDPDAVVQKYLDKIEKQAEAYEKSPEGRKAAARFEESQRQRKALNDEVTRTLEGTFFESSDPESFEHTLKVNEDGGYGEAILRYADRWARLMQVEMARGKPLESVAERTSHDADNEGITGFMYGCAVSILAKTWIHGEHLRRWHNKDCQIGNEGDVANETGGVLNPAVLSIR